MQSVGTKSWIKNTRSQSFLAEAYTHAWTTTHSHIPWSMLYFSTSLKTCLVSILGWIWLMHCLFREKCGNLLWKHTHADTMSSYSVTLMAAFILLVAIHSHMFHTRLSLPPWSWGGTTSLAVWPVVVLDDCGPWRRTRPMAIYSAGLVVHTSTEEDCGWWKLVRDFGKAILKGSDLTHLKG